MSHYILEYIKYGDESAPIKVIFDGYPTKEALFHMLNEWEIDSMVTVRDIVEGHRTIYLGSFVISLKPCTVRSCKTGKAKTE